MLAVSYLRLRLSKCPELTQMKEYYCREKHAIDKVAASEISKSGDIREPVEIVGTIVSDCRVRLPGAKVILPKCQSSKSISPGKSNIRQALVLPQKLLRLQLKMEAKAQSVQMAGTA